MPKSPARKPSEIYFYVPNLIGYARIIFAFLAFHYAYSNYIYFAVCYSISMGLDAFDGMAARALKGSETSETRASRGGGGERPGHAATGGTAVRASRPSSARRYR